MKGTIKRFYFKKGFGFIENEAGEELFFHYSDFDGPKKYLRADAQVTFTETQGEKGPCAVDIEVEGYDPSQRDETTNRPAKQARQTSRPTANQNHAPASKGIGGPLLTGLMIGIVIGATVGYTFAKATLGG